MKSVNDYSSTCKQKHRILQYCLTFLEYKYKFGVLPGTGIPALVSLIKYFCTLLAT